MISALDQMGPFHILLDEMGLDLMGLDEVRIVLRVSVKMSNLRMFKSIN